MFLGGFGLQQCRRKQLRTSPATARGPPKSAYSTENSCTQAYCDETAPPAPSLAGVEEPSLPSSRDALFPKAIGLI